jgi:hypothetical protein
VDCLTLVQANSQVVIPAQAGIQLIKKSPAKRDNTKGLSAARAVSQTGFRPAPE